jgi:hypothetical protein
MTPDGLEKLVNLQLMVTKQRAESAFNRAMAEFAAACPPILKNREAYDDRKDRLMYTFADLPQIMRVIDPVLHQFGLSYTFDSDVDGDKVTVVCNVHHVDGHSRPAKFTCQATGTSIMSQPQKMASAMTFGRRYALQAAFGLCIDNDVDARDLTPPETPNHKADAPRTQTRETRATKDDCEGLLAEWKRVTGKTDFDAYIQWASSITAIAQDDCRLVASWTKQAIEHCHNELRKASR